MTDWTGTWTYHYDANNRLDDATPPTPVPEQPAGGPYEYDWVGNRVRPPRDPGPNPPTNTNKMVYNEADQLLQWPGMHGADTTTHAGYVCYPDGSLQYERNAAGTDWMKSYSYTPDGLLHEANYDRTSSTACTYLKNTWDADKNRVKYEVGLDNIVGETHNHTLQYSHTFVYDTTAGIPAVIQEDGVYCVREPGGELLARLDSVNGIRYYHFDELGSTRLLTKSTGDVTDKYAYDAYGALLAHERLAGSVPQPYQYVGRLGYYTHVQEPGFGLLQLGVRFYASSVGRFTQEDPVQDGPDWYVYTAANPNVDTDPTGLAPAMCHQLCHRDPFPPSGGDAFTERWKCAHEMVAAAQAEVLRLGVPGIHNGPGDALRHCIGSCKMVAHCPWGTAELAGYGHEWPGLWGARLCGGYLSPVGGESEMDLHNNLIGRSCGCVVKTPPEAISAPGSKGPKDPKWNGSCLGCCLGALRSGQLVTLPRKRWE